MVAYSDAGPVSGKVPPIVTVVAVTPTSLVAGDAPAAKTPSAATTAATATANLRIDAPSIRVVCRGGTLSPVYRNAKNRRRPRRPEVRRRLPELVRESLG